MKTAEIKIVLVPHGYQIDVDCGKLKGSECRDYGGSIDPEEAVRVILKAVQGLEATAPQKKRKQRAKQEPS